jgi:hypothetical protein
MGGQTQEDVDQNLLTPEALVDFIEELRHAGFNIGMTEYIAAQDLLLMLIARGEKLDSPQRISSLFGPLLCSSPAEQESFPEFFLRWNQRYQASKGRQRIAHVETMAETLEKTARRSLRWEWILFGLGVAILALTVWFVARNFIQQPGPPPDGPGPSGGEVRDLRPLIQLASVSIGLLALVYFAWWVWWRRVASQFLQRRQSQGNPDIKRISLIASDEALFPSLTFLSLARMFRQRVQVVSRDLNVIGTVKKSVEQGGWLDPLYDRLMIPPEYLVLVDRRSRFDHLAQFMEGMVKQLEIHGVFLTVYTFDGDPRLCFPLRGPGRPQALSELVASSETTRLILFTEAENLLSPVSGRLAPWSRLFNRWLQRAVMTPESAIHWGESERELQREFIVLPGTAEGLAEFMRILHGRQSTVEINEWAVSVRPSLLQERPQRWMERDAPSTSQIDSLFQELKGFLDEEGYTWLKACAVYPELQWQITITLGQLLKDSQGKPLLDPKRILDLARLPWFRYGLMPDWLRTRLILDLEPEREQEVRAALEALLVTAVQGHGESLDLEVAYEHRDWTSRLARPLIKLLGRESPPESPVNDHVFLDFMLQRLNLAVRVPETLRRRLLADVGDQAGWKVLLQWIGANSAAIVPYLLISITSAALDFTHLHTPTGTEVPVALLASLLIGPLLGLAQWLVLRRFWRLHAFSWIGWTTFALSTIPSLVLFYSVFVGGSGPQLYGSEFGLTSLAILGVVQARLLARHNIASSNLWWIGGIGIGLLNTLASFAFVQETVSEIDLRLALFILSTAIVYGLISGWILLHALQSRKIALSQLIRPIWVLSNVLGFAIGALLAFVLIVGVDAFGRNSSGDVFVSIALMLIYLPISLSQWSVFRSYRFPYSGSWFWITFLIPVLIFFLVFLPLADRGSLDSRVLIILTGLLVGIVSGFFQALLWRRTGLQPFFALVWFLCNTIGWSFAFIGIIALTPVMNYFTPVTWDHAVASLLSLTVLPYAIVTALPLAPFLQEALRRQPPLQDAISFELTKIRVSPAARIAQIAGRDSSDHAPL